MDLEKALELWRGSAYKRINGYLIKEHTNSRVKALQYTGRLPPLDEENGYTEDDIPEIVGILRASMKPIDSSITYYRGASGKRKVNCHVETFISISINKDDAGAFADEGIVYEITVKSEVRGIKTGVEGEVLLEDGCYWEYLGGDKVMIHPPSSEKAFDWCTDVIKRGGYRNRKKTQKSIRRFRKTFRRRN